MDTIYDKLMTADESVKFRQNCKHEFSRYEEVDCIKSITTCLLCGHQWYPKIENKGVCREGGR